MEITVVGWHLMPMPNQCHDCGEASAVIVTRTGEMSDFELCSDCLHHPWYTITEDQIAKVFRELGL